MTDGSSAHSMYEVIARKRDGHALSTSEIEYFVSRYAGGEIPDYQAAAWLMAVYIHGMSPRELADLTRTMMESGDRVNVDDVPGKKIDKHSTGGVGDKISFIVSPLVAACGVKVPMISGRSLGHTGGTLDKLESIPGFNVSLDDGQFRRVLADTGMVICGQTDNIVPADRKLYALRDTTATVDSIPLISASIMSKKLALQSDGMVLDVKTGSGAFMTKEEDAVQLCQTMVEIGELQNRTTIGLITDMDQPLGHAVGNGVEIVESIETLKGNGPQDLLEVSFALGAAMLVAAGAEPDYQKGLKRMEEALRSGEPAALFKKLIAAQGGDPAVCDDYSLLPQAQYQIPFTAPTDGYVSRINAFDIGMAAITIGAGRKQKGDQIDHAAGFLFNKKVGDAVKKGETILTILTNKADTVETAKKRLAAAVAVNDTPPPPRKRIRFVVDRHGLREWRY